ncbi:hypothetical protein F5880DRAFT_1618996 [Lentinula raphanica]|nr:hypothetical protein F5880DRAFT_1618996 [Lentinula raphanica]
MDSNGDRDEDDSTTRTRTTRRRGRGRLDGGDEDDSTAWTRTTRWRGRGRLDGMDEDESAEVDENCTSLRNDRTRTTINRRHTNSERDEDDSTAVPIRSEDHAESIRNETNGQSHGIVLLPPAPSLSSTISFRRPPTRVKGHRACWPARSISSTSRTCICARYIGGLTRALPFKGSCFPQVYSHSTSMSLSATTLPSSGLPLQGPPNSLSTSALSVSSPDVVANTSSGTAVMVPTNASMSPLSGLPIQDLLDPHSTSPHLSMTIDTTMSASLETNLIVSANTPAFPVSSSILDVATKASDGTEVTASMNALETSLSSPVNNIDSNVSSGTDVTVDSIRSAFLHFMAANHLLDSAAIASGFSDSFVDGLVYCLLGHGIGICQLTGTHDLERTIIMQQLDEAQVAQAAAETARDSMQSFVDAAAAHQDQCEQELQELRLKYHQLEEQLDDANLQLAAARGEVDFTTAQNTLMEDENTRLENDNDRLVEDRKVLASQNEVLFKSLLSHQETLEYLLKKDSPAEVLHELGRSKEELERVQRDLELSRSSVQTLQETISLHLDTISVKDEQIYVLNTLINTLENRVSTVQASSLVVSQQHTDLVLAHSATSTTLNAIPGCHLS